MSMNRGSGKLIIKSYAGMNAGQFCSWLDTGRIFVGVPTVISNGKTRLGINFVPAVVCAIRGRIHGRIATSGNVTIVTKLEVLLVKRRRTIHSAMGNLHITTNSRGREVCRVLLLNL